jgi:PAS domain S-box-containing protein
MDQAPVAVMAANEAGYYIYSNAAAQALLGYSPDELRTHHVIDLHADDPEWFRAELALLRRSCIWNGRLLLRHADGGLLKVAVNAFLDDLPGRCTYICLYRPIPSDPSEAGRVVPDLALDFPFTSHEFAALQLLAEGFDDSQIADVIGIPRAAAPHTINAILRKLNARSRTEACILALKQGLVF